MDHFLNDPVLIRNIAISSGFGEVVSPYDGGVFPGISTAVPATLIAEIIQKITSILGKRPIIKESVFRLTKAGYTPYQYVHTDETIAPYAILIYLNQNFPDGAGTEVMLPKKNGVSDPNNPTHWKPTVFSAMKFNRAFIFNAGHFHGALPREGFGDSDENSRLIFIGWFGF